ncbi:MAG: hypothetical protein WCL14_08925 [Bacteroidota bacterium]
MKKVADSSSPKKVSKNSAGTAMRRKSNGSEANKKLLAKVKRDNRKAKYNSRNIINANRVYQAPVPVGGMRGVLVSAIIVLTLYFGKRNSSDSSKSVSQTDGKKSVRRIGKSNPYFILSILPNPNQIITAILKMPKSYKLRGDWARAIINACSGNAYIVILPATITAYLALLAAFVTAQTNMKLRTVGLKPIRDNAWKLVMNALNALMAVAQANGNTNPATAITIIQSGLFTVKMVSGAKPTIYKVTNTNTSGTMKMVAPGAPRIAFHIWEKSVDGVAWVPVGNSHKSRMSYPGFIPVSKVWVRHRIDNNGVLSAWQYFYVTVE